MQIKGHPEFDYQERGFNCQYESTDDTNANWARPDGQPDSDQVCHQLRKRDTGSKDR